MLNPHHAVCVGSFDPITLGHFDIIQRGASLYDQVTVGIGINPEKGPLFTPQERLELVQLVLAPLPNVTVACFEGLAVDFVQRCGAKVMLRGIRTLTDMDAELTMSLANHVLAPEIEMVFLMASEKYSHISSSLIKQVALLGAESAAEPLRAFIPSQVIGPLRAKFSRSR